MFREIKYRCNMMMSWLVKTLQAIGIASYLTTVWKYRKSMLSQSAELRKREAELQEAKAELQQARETSRWQLGLLDRLRLA
mmetsp:Transcript_29934/g.76793  ORF Transcript_29934/g.76793 Transcript_29934/m.76793 type:complete len:81 (-) Transcript_29934:295-537(-)